MVGSLTRCTPQYSGAGHVTTCGLQYTVTAWPRCTRRVATFSTHVSTPLYRAGIPREPSSAIFTRSSTSSTSVSIRHPWVAVRTAQGRLPAYHVQIIKDAVQRYGLPVPASYIIM